MAREPSGGRVRLAIVVFAVGLASCQGQHVAPVVVIPDVPTRVLKVTIPATIDEEAFVCIEVTSEMRAERVLGLEVCGPTVGELRKEFARLSNAN